jgi:hypothetical protein
MESSRRANATTQIGEQYSLGKILGIWALAAIPMGILSWIVFPAVSPDFNSDPLSAGVKRIALLTSGLIWLFVLSMIIVRQEEGNLRWETIKRRLWLNAPRDPKTGDPRRRLWLWVIPFLIAIVVWEVALKSYVNEAWVSIFPFFAGRGVPVSRRVASQDGGSIWQVELAGKRGAACLVACSPTLGYRGDCHRLCLSLHISELALPQHLDGRHRPFCSKCVLCIHSPWSHIGFGIGAKQENYSRTTRSDVRQPQRS